MNHNLFEMYPENQYDASQGENSFISAPNISAMDFNNNVPNYQTDSILDYLLTWSQSQQQFPVAEPHQQQFMNSWSSAIPPQTNTNESTPIIIEETQQQSCDINFSKKSKDDDESNAVQENLKILGFEWEMDPNSDEETEIYFFVKKFYSKYMLVQKRTVRLRSKTGQELILNQFSEFQSQKLENRCHTNTSQG